MSAFDWHGYYLLAEELIGRAADDPTAPSTEAAHRTAVSRAYYAAFGLARDYLRGKSVAVLSAGSGHDRVWTAFHGMPDTIHRRIADRGRVLKLIRGRADYDAGTPVLATDAVTAVEFARQLVADIDSLS